MAGYGALQQQLTTTLGLTRPPVAVAFRDTPPAGVRKWSGRQPSGCSFWRIAAAGHAFYTVPSDHYGCVIGSHTHNIPLPPGRARELPDMLEFMTGIGYIRMEEVAGIPQLPATPGAVVYAPLGETPVDPDVVLFAGRPGRLMLLQEAARRAGIGTEMPALGRPTCMALPAAMTHGLVTSTGCIGNRVYTDLGEDELYVAVAGRDLSRLAAEAAVIAEANAKLLEHHRERRSALATE
jgi:uncharacterized protein (DUF169 family)